MTPTPEMIAMAERIADEKNDIRGCANWWRSRDVALTAIMETSEKAAEHASTWDRVVAMTIRHGEHLR